MATHLLETMKNEVKNIPNEVMNMPNETIDGVEHRWRTLWEGVETVDSVLFWPKSMEYGILTDPNTKKVRVSVEGKLAYGLVGLDKVERGFLGYDLGNVFFLILPERAKLQACDIGTYRIIYYLTPIINHQPRGNTMSKKDINFLNKEQVKMQEALNKQAALIKELCASNDDNEMLARIDEHLPSFEKIGKLAKEQEKQINRLYKEGKPYSHNLLDCIRAREEVMQRLVEVIYDTGDFWVDNDE